MKITCDSCQAKYTIADEKVVGKIVKIKCKKCGTTIVVDGNAAAAQQAAPPRVDPALAGPGGEEDGETRVFGQGGADEWTVNVTDDDQRTMTAPQVVAEYQHGTINGDTYVWRDGMPDWLPLSEVPELMQMMPAPYSAPVSSRPVSSRPAAGGGLGGTVMMHDQQPSPFAARPAAGAASPAAAASAARRAGGRAGSVDLFGAAAAERAPAAPSPPEPLDHRAVGERNENSVLFSLSALTAAENAARAQSKGDEAVLDLRPSPNRPNPTRNNGRAGLDDIMNLGGGGIGGGMAPMLAPPPLLAPVVEAPPPPPPPAPVAAAGSMPPSAMPMQFAQAYPQKKSPVGLIVGIVLGLAVVGGVAFFALRSPAEPVAQNTTPETPTSGPITQAATAPTQTAEPPTDTAPSATASGPDTAPSTQPSTKPTAASKDPKDDSKAKAKDEPKPKDEPKAKDEPKPKDEPPPAAEAGNGREFNRAAASSALGGAAGAAKGCKKADGPTGSGKVRVTFAPSGNVTSASVQGGPFAGTSVGGCIASAFRSAKVPPFDGSPVTVTKSFSIN